MQIFSFFPRMSYSMQSKQENVYLYLQHPFNPSAVSYFSTYFPFFLFTLITLPMSLCMVPFLMRRKRSSWCNFLFFFLIHRPELT